MRWDDIIMWCWGCSWSTTIGSEIRYSSFFFFSWKETFSFVINTRCTKWWSSKKRNQVQFQTTIEENCLFLCNNWYFCNIHQDQSSHLNTFGPINGFLKNECTCLAIILHYIWHVYFVPYSRNSRFFTKKLFLD